MAAPAVDSSSSLNALDTPNELFVRALGRNGNVACYLICTYKGKVILTVAVEETKAEITVRNMKQEVVLSGYGGLKSIPDKMHIYSTLNGFNKQIAFIERYKLLDMTEVDPQLQFVMPEPNEDTLLSYRYNLGYLNSYIAMIAQRKDLIQPGNKFPTSTNSTITGSTQSATVLVRCHSLLTLLKKAILVMAGIKLYYCLYRFHQHPMPMGVPCHMPPVKASPPSLNMLQTLRDVKLRYFCPGRNDQRFFEILHGQTLAVLLVAEVQLFEDHKKLDIVFKDISGVLQFRLNTESYIYAIYDSFTRVLGTIHYNSYNSTTQRCGGKKMEVLSRDQYDSHVFHIKFGQSKNHDAEFTLNDTMNIMELSMREDLGVEIKAMLMADATSTAIMHYRVCSRGFYPVLNEYPYRRQK